MTNDSAGIPLALIVAIVLGVVVLVLAAVTILLPGRRRREQAGEAARALQLHATTPGPQARDALLNALRHTLEKTTTRELLDVAATYGRESLLESPRLAALPIPTASALGERVARLERRGEVPMGTVASGR
ncbi:MAG: hypothetical protein LC640_02495, partial [Frankia sp.]|nr:hypothetical protein [Frankia sp.]